MGTVSRGRRAGANRTGGRGKPKQNNSNRVGAAWENLDDDGNVANISVQISEDWEGTISGGDRVILFPNSFKEKPTHPDYNLVKFDD